MSRSAAAPRAQTFTAIAAAWLSTRLPVDVSEEVGDAFAEAKRAAWAGATNFARAVERFVAAAETDGDVRLEAVVREARGSVSEDKR